MPTHGPGTRTAESLWRGVPDALASSEGHRPGPARAESESWLLPATCVRVFGDNVSTLATCRVTVLPGTCASSVMPWGTDLGFQSGAPLTRPGASGRSPTTRGLHVFRRGAGSPAAGCVWPDSRSSVPSERPVRARAKAAGLLWSAPASRLAHSPADSALPRRTGGAMARCRRRH